MAPVDRMDGQYLDARGAGGPDWPATGGFAITPSDSVDLPRVTRSIYVGAAGNVKVNLAYAPGGTPESVTLTAVPAGTFIPVRATRVFATGTTATGLVGLD